jgi:hypothetical protein
VSEKREKVMLADGRIFCLSQVSGIVRKIDLLKNPSDADLDDHEAVMYDELWETLVAENKARLEIYFQSLRRSPKTSRGLNRKAVEISIDG